MAAAIAASLGQAGPTTTSSAVEAVRDRSTKEDKKCVEAGRRAQDEDKDEEEKEAQEEAEVDEAQKDCTLQVRLPDGKQLLGRFRSEDTLRRVWLWVRRQRRAPEAPSGDAPAPESSPSRARRFSLATNFPRRVFTQEELARLTLREAGLAPRAVLWVQDEDT
jgi:hypothetical protein